MVIYQWISLAALCISMRTHSATGDGFYRVCYFDNWFRSKSNLAKLTIQDIDPFLCTHLIYAYVGFHRWMFELRPIYILDEEGENGDFKKFTRLKSKNVKLKTLISSKGDNIIIGIFASVEFMDAKLDNFITTTITFLRNRNFDGLEIDLPFPNNESKNNVNKLLKSLRDAFDAEAVEPERRLLLTMAVSQTNDKISAYDVKELAKYVDFANLMTYNYDSSNNKIAAFNSPLYSRTGDPRFNQEYSTNWTVHRWMELGLPVSKIVVGVTGVGRRLVLLDRKRTEPGSPTTGAVRKGDLYFLQAALAFPEICLWLKNTSTVRKFDEQQKNPYLVYLDNWVGYEDEESIRIKVEWMKSLGVKGLMFWSLDQDDFSGKQCNKGIYPLLSLVKMLTTNSSISATEASTPAAVTTAAVTTAAVTTAAVATVSSKISPLQPAIVATITTALQTTTILPSTVSSTVLTTKKTTPGKILATSPSDVVREIEPGFYHGCYFISWAQFRDNLAKHTIQDIDPLLCTHLIYVRAMVDTVKSEPSSHAPWHEEVDNGDFRKFTDIKKTNPFLKTLISIGDGDSEFVELTNSKEKINHFAKSMVQFLRRYKFDGIEVNWNYPSTKSKKTVTMLLESLRQNFDADVKKPKLLLAMTLAPFDWIISTAYDIKELAKLLDFGVVDTCEYSSVNSTYNLFNSPLYSRTGDWKFNEKYSMNWTVHRWLELGFPVNKTVVCVTSLGVRHVLSELQSTEPGSPTLPDIMRVGELYHYISSLAYPEICSWLQKDNVVRKFDQVQKNPYFVYQDNWVGYEDEASLKLKVEWMKDLGVRGLIFRALDADDFSGKLCGKGKYPLLHTINKIVLEKLKKPSIKKTSIFTTVSTAISTTSQLHNQPEMTTSTGPNTAMTTLEEKVGPTAIMSTMQVLEYISNDQSSLIHKWNVFILLQGILLLVCLG